VSLFDMVMSQLGAQTGEVSRQLGADQDQTRTAMAAAVPLLMGALTRNASQPEGAASLLGALSRDHDGSILDDVGGALKAPDAAAGDGILGHVLGSRRSAVETGVSSTSGLDPQSVSRMLTMLAPVIMGALGRTQRQQNLDAGGLASLLGAEREQAVAATPELGMLAGLLDSDNDGQIMDDLGKMGKSVLGGILGGRKQ